ncbi:MAG: TlpA family protein disulfide reductase [Zoogloea sp.]|nr:TlpA family protein disulfide reductase [Zoogloea sp.]
MKNSTRYTLVAIAGLAAAAAGLYTSQAAMPPAPAAEGAQNGAALLAQTLPDLDNKPQALAQWKGKVLVVNYWATWCPPCRKEIPAFSQASRAWSGKGVQFVGISIDTPASVREFQAEMKVPYPLLIGSAQAVQLTAGLGNTAQALPFTVIVDRQGMVRHVKMGMLSEADLNARLKALAGG